VLGTVVICKGWAAAGVPYLPRNREGDGSMGVDPAWRSPQGNRGLLSSTPASLGLQDTETSLLLNPCVLEEAHCLGGNSLRWFVEYRD
jgi:hypothetical protein